MNKLSLHRAFSSMNLFIKANGKQKEIAKRDCELVAGGTVPNNPPSIKKNVADKRVLSINTCSSVFGAAAVYVLPRVQKTVCELSTSQCAEVSGGATANKRPRAASAGIQFIAFPTTPSIDSQG